MKAIVVAGGDAAPEDAAHLEAADFVIAADSGAKWLVAHGIRPRAIVGDMDSIDPELLARLAAEGVEIDRHPTDKDASDAELALQRTLRDGADDVVLIGALGGDRLDHQLANLMLLADPAWGPSRLRIVRGTTVARALRGPGRLPLEGSEGDTVTLLPVGGDAAGVGTEGLRFPLSAEPLLMGRSRGLSNEIQAQPASVSLESGTLLVIETRKEQVR